VSATKTTLDTIREFLQLPNTAMPQAYYTNIDEGCNAWRQLRDYVRPKADQEINHCGESVTLKADRDGWRDGITVVLA
jgi:hypothetical protein